MLKEPNPFNEGEDDEAGDAEDYVPVSIIMEEILLRHYYVLTKRGAYRGTESDFDELDTYRMYTLLEWENDAIEEERRQMEEAEAKANGGNQKTGKRFDVEDDPSSVDLYNQLSGRDLDD